MKKILILTSLIIITQPVFAHNAHSGKQIFKENCTRCHALQHDKILSKNKKGFKTKAKLAAMVSRCVSMTGADIFPEDEAKIVNYLNREYYHLK